MESHENPDIRERIRAHGARQLVIARMSAPADWEGELRRALVSERAATARPWGSKDAWLFAQSFAIFFTAAMMFLM